MRQNHGRRTAYVPQNGDKGIWGFAVSDQHERINDARAHGCKALFRQTMRKTFERTKEIQIQATMEWRAVQITINNG